MREVFHTHYVVTSVYDNARFTTLHLKPLCVRRVQRYACVNLSNIETRCIQ